MDYVPVVLEPDVDRIVFLGALWAADFRDVRFYSFLLVAECPLGRDIRGGAFMFGAWARARYRLQVEEILCHGPIRVQGWAVVVLVFVFGVAKYGYHVPLPVLVWVVVVGFFL